MDLMYHSAECTTAHPSDFKASRCRVHLGLTDIGLLLYPSASVAWSRSENSCISLLSTTRAVGNISSNLSRASRGCDTYAYNRHTYQFQVLGGNGKLDPSRCKSADEESKVNALQCSALSHTSSLNAAVGRSKQPVNSFTMQKPSNVQNSKFKASTSVLIFPIETNRLCRTE